MNAFRPFRGRVALSGLALSAVLSFPASMNAQLDRSAPPHPAPPPAVNMAGHSSFTLGNGMRVIVVENSKLPLVSVQVRFDVPPTVQGELAGHVDLFGELLAAGTAKRSKAELDEAVDRSGAMFSTGSDGLFISGLRRNVEAMLDIASEVVTAAVFPDDEFEKARMRYLSGIRQRRSEPDAIAEVVGRSVTFGGDHPYGEVVTEASVQRITPEHVRAYYRRFIRPEKGYLVFVGDLDAKEAEAWARKFFGKWKVPSMTATVNKDGGEEVKGLGTVRYIGSPVVPTVDRRVVLVDRPGAAQSVIRVAFPLDLEPKDPRAMSAQVMNTILGGGVFNARLMQNLREDKGYTYTIRSSVDADRYNGGFQAGLSVRTEVTADAVSEIVHELERMREGNVSQEELDLARSYMAGSFARGLEDPRTVARFALNTFLNGLAEDHYATYLQRLDAVGMDDVRTAARTFLHPDKAVVVVVGDKEKVMAALAALTLPAGDPVLLVDEDGVPVVQ